MNLEEKKEKIIKSSTNIPVMINNWAGIFLVIFCIQASTVFTFIIQNLQSQYVKYFQNHDSVH